MAIPTYNVYFVCFRAWCHGEQLAKLVPSCVFFRVDGKKRCRDRFVPWTQPYVQTSSLSGQMGARKHTPNSRIKRDDVAKVEPMVHGSRHLMGRVRHANGQMSISQLTARLPPNE